MTAKTMLAEAAGQEGYRPAADGSTRFGTWFAGLVHAPVYTKGDWCAMFLLWCAWRSGQLTALGGVDKRWAWVPSWAAWFQDSGRWTQEPAPGAVVFYDFNHNGVAEHVGLVVKDNGDGTITTIEGNTSDPRTGVEPVCALRTRPKGEVLGYGHPAYPAPAPAPVDDDFYMMG